MNGFYTYRYSGPNQAKWGHYVISGVLFTSIVFLLLISARRSAFKRHEKVGKFFTSICACEIVVWVIYALVWGLAVENHLMSVDVEIILLAIVYPFVKALIL
jgi:bacteriorhodopsin